MQTSLLIPILLLFVGATSAFVPRPELQLKATGKVCEICEIVVKVTAGLLNLDQNMIEAQLDKDCDNLGGLAGVCKMVVNNFLPKIIQYLNEGNSAEQVCERLKLCTASPTSPASQVRPAPSKVTGKGTKPICTVCEMLVKLVAGMANMDENQIKQKLEQECTDLGPLASICKGLVDTYLPRIIDSLNQGDSADKICVKLGLCTASVYLRKRAPQPKELSCEICDILVKVAGQYLNSSETTVENELYAACGKLGPLESLCKSLVKEYVEKIVNFLNQGTSPDQICQQLGLCDSKKALKAVGVEDKQPKGLTCTLCTKLVTDVVQFLNQSEPQIQQDMDQYCQDLGSPLGSVCKMIVDNYLPQIVKYLNQGKNATWVCSEIDLCSTMQKEIEEAKREAEKQAKGISCTICTMIVEAATQYINLTEPEIASKLKEVCKKLDFLESACDDLVDKYLPQIVKYLQSGSTAQEVCSKLELCSKAMRLVRSEILRPQPRGISCTLCEKVVQLVDKLLGNDENQIKAMVKKECAMMGPLASQCQNIVDGYLDKIIQFLNEGTAAEEVCTKVGLCQQSKAHVANVGASQDCSICSAMAQLAVNLLNQGMSQDDVKSRLLTECNKFGSTTERCKSIIEQNFLQFINYLQGGMTPMQLCTKLGYCT